MSDIYCLICNDNTYKTFTCHNCKYISCLLCIKKIKNFICCNCNTIYNDNIIKPFIKDQDVLNIYMEFYIENKIKNYTNFLIKQSILTVENKKLLRFGYQKIESDFEYIFMCNNNDCDGMINLNYYCNDCKMVYCKQCEEIMKDESHVCDQNILQTINDLKENCKKCVNCYTYLEKVDGCNDMRCLNCGIYFNWRNLKIDLNGNTNLTKDQDIIHLENKFFNVNMFYDVIRNNRQPDGLLLQEVIKKYSNLIKVLELFEGEYFIAKEKNKLNEKICKKIYFMYKKEFYYRLILNFYKKKTFQGEDLIKIININNWELKTFLKKIHRTYIFPKSFLYRFSSRRFIANNDNTNYISLNVELKISDMKCINKTITKDNNKVLPLPLKRDNTILKKLLTYRIHIKICSDYKNKIYDSLYIIKNLNIENVVLVVPNNNIEKYWKLHLNKFDKGNIKIIYITNKNMFTKKDYDSFIKIVIEYIIDKPYLLIIDELYLYKDKSYDTFSDLIYMTFENRFDENRYFLGFSAIPPRDSIFYKMIISKENEFLKKFDIRNIILEMLTYLTKSEILELLKKVYYGKNYNNGNVAYPYLTNDKIFKNKIKKNFPSYNLNNWCQVNIFTYKKKKIINGKTEIEDFSHDLCKKERTNCKFCSICNPEYVENDLISCCYIHIKPNLKLKLNHEICYDEKLTITENISILTCKLFIDVSYINKITKILLQYGFNLYEINFLLNTITKNVNFIKEYNKFIFNKTFCSENNILQIFTKKYLLNEKETECMNSSFTNFDYINKTRITSCYVVSTKGYMQLETMYINNIYKDITEIYNKYNKVKIIVGLYFNSTITDLQNLLEKNNYNYLILNNNISNPDLVIKRFNTGNYILLSNVKSYNKTTEPIDDRCGNEPRYILIPFIYDVINTSLFFKRTYTEFSESYPVIHVLDNYINQNLYKIKKYNFNVAEWKTNDLWNCFI